MIAVGCFRISTQFSLYLIPKSFFANSLSSAFLRIIVSVRYFHASFHINNKYNNVPITIKCIFLLRNIQVNSRRAYSYIFTHTCAYYTLLLLPWKYEIKKKKKYFKNHLTNSKPRLPLFNEPLIFLLYL
jgi:hypothetical protein